jgi:hypothetical protein
MFGYLRVKLYVVINYVFKKTFKTTTTTTTIEKKKQKMRRKKR